MIKWLLIPTVIITTLSACGYSNSRIQSNNGTRIEGYPTYNTETGYMDYYGNRLDSGAEINSIRPSNDITYDDFNHNNGIG